MIKKITIVLTPNYNNKTKVVCQLSFKQKCIFIIIILFFLLARSQDEILTSI